MADGEMIPVEPSVGPPLAARAVQLPAASRVQAAAASPMRRAEFFYSDPDSVGTAKYGEFFISPAYRTYRATPFSFVRLDNVSLIGWDGVVLQDGSAIPETVDFIQVWAPESLIETYESRTTLKLKRPLGVSQAQPSGSYLIGFTPAWRNYAHWTQQVLPMLVGFLFMQQTVPDLRVVLPGFAQGSFQQQTIDLLGIPPESIYRIAPDEVLRFEAAWVASAIDIWGVPAATVIAAKHLADQAALRCEPRKSGASRLYIHRQLTARRVANFEQLQPLLALYDFEIVTFENAPLVEQITAMQDARLLIGEHGAGLANILFCQPDAFVLELFNPMTPQPAFWSVASAAGLKYGYLVGTHVWTEEFPEPGWNAAYDVSPVKLENAIRAMLGLQPLASERWSTSGRDRARRGKELQMSSVGVPEVVFTEHDKFEIGGLKFALASGQTESTPDRLLVYKDRGFVDSYISVIPPMQPKRAFEFGIYQGGSSVFLTALCDLEKFVCLDISDPIEVFDEFRRTHKLGERISAHYRTSQDDAERIREIFATEFGDDPPDLIIDDASHQYELTKRSFEIAFPLLRDGGHYLIEDWSWAHWPENQDASHGWNHLPAMTNLILELVMLLPSSLLIEEVTVRQGFVVIRKKSSPADAADFSISAALRTRGRVLDKI